MPLTLNQEFILEAMRKMAPPQQRAVIVFAARLLKKRPILWTKNRTPKQQASGPFAAYDVSADGQRFLYLVPLEHTRLSF
jgi:hypothetical protein